MKEQKALKALPASNASLQSLLLNFVTFCFETLMCCFAQLRNQVVI